MPDYPDLPELPQNAILLDYLRPEAKPAEDQSRLGKWEMRAHPDLTEWMESLAPGQPVHAAYGAPVLTTAGVAAVVAIGTDHMLLRLWSVPDDLKTGIPTPPLTDQGWRLVDAWQNQLSRPDWKRRLSALIKLALWQASVPYYPDLPELPQNAALLDDLRPYGKPAKDQWRLGAWEIRTHPDLTERMESLAPGQPVHSAYGVPVLALAGIAAVVAVGTSDILVRLPSVPEDLAVGTPRPPLTDEDWRSVDAWQSQLSGPEGKRRLSELIRLALDHVSSLAS